MKTNLLVGNNKSSSQQFMETNVYLRKKKNPTYIIWCYTSEMQASNNQQLESNKRKETSNIMKK